MQQITNPPSPPYPLGLGEAIRAGGHTIITDQDGWWTEDAAAVQSIIDTFVGSAAELTAHKSAKLLVLEEQYTSIIAAGRLYSVTGGTDATQHTYQIDDVAPVDPSTKTPTRRDSQSTITTMGQWAANVVNGVPNTAPWPSNFEWQDANNLGVPMTAAQCYAFSQNVAAYVAACEMSFFSLRAQISAQTTASAVDAIDVTAGWPSNP